MDRLTIRDDDGAWDVPLRGEDDGAYFPLQEIIDRLARYEDSGLEPEEVRGIKTAYDEVQIPYEVAATGADAARVIRLLDADDEGRLVVLPCGDDVTLEYNGLLYKGDHWNPPTLTAFAADPSTPSGLRLHLFGIEEAEKALGGDEK